MTLKHTTIDSALRLQRRIARLLINPVACCLSHVVDVVFPHCCVACHADTPVTGFCDKCLSLIIDQHRTCQFCAATIPQYGNNTRNCVECRDGRWWIENAVRLGQHTNLLRDLCLAHKFTRNELIGRLLSALLLDQRRSEITDWNIDVVVPVPMHWLRRIEQGFNHAETISKTIAESLSLNHCPKALVRRRKARPQRRLSRRVRSRNVKGVFQIRKGYDLSRKRVLLVDDIMTTGATANEVARILRRAGATFVAVAVLARRERRTDPPATFGTRL